MQRPLISEALRGEGAHLVDEAGKRFMVGQHELAELAPRDVVAKGIHRVLRSTGADHVYLDARHLGAEFLEHRFPTIVASTRAAGVDPATDLIPVAPAAHYASGGVRTDLHGRTSIPGLYACGEVACTGVHGANRLASNSLLEGLVFARRIADDIARELPGAGRSGGRRRPVRPGWRRRRSGAELQRAMTRGAGVLRSADSLAATAEELARLGRAAHHPAQRGLGGDQPADRGRGPGRGGQQPGGRPAAATGGRTTRWPPTSGAATCCTASTRRPADPDLRGDAASTTERDRQPRSEMAPARRAGSIWPRWQRIVYTALAEDLGDPPRDVTSEATIPGGQVDTAELVARADGVVAGLPVAAQVFAATSGGTATFEARVAEGDRVGRGDVLAVVSGPTRALLTAERTALNLLCRMSGVATHTRRWADALAGTKATVLDTRKTTPGLRVLEKYAVRAGGGTNKRMGLYDVAMIKDNHKLAAGSITAAYRLVRERSRRCRCRSR